MTEHFELTTEKMARLNDLLQMNTNELVRQYATEEKKRILDSAVIVKEDEPFHEKDIPGVHRY